MSKKIWSLIFVITLLAFFLRFYHVTEDPPSLNWDEVSIGYNAYSILKTGRDEWGEFMPIHFKSYGEYKLPAQIYASIPAIAIFGLNDFGVRITPVIYGTLTIFVLFFLTWEIYKNEWISFGSAFLLAISPWHIQLTRASFESSFAVFWFLLGLWFLIKGFEKSNWLIWAMIPFGISIYTYNTTRIFTPLFLVVILLIYSRYFLKNKKQVIIAGILFIAMLIPMIPFVISGGSNARYKLVSVADDPGLVPRINENRGHSQLPQPLPRLVHNKVTYIVMYVSGHYLAHFSPQFLFISGAPHKQHHVQNMGELYYFQAPLLLVGLIFLFLLKERFRWVLLSWLLLAYVPVAVTNDSIPHALRTAVAGPFYQIISSYGGFKIFEWLKKRNLKHWIVVGSLAIVVAAIGQFIFYLYQYYEVYPKAYSRDWQYGYEQVVDYMKQNQNKYDLIVFSRHYGEPHMFTLFYEQYDPATYQNNPNLIRYETNDWVWVLKFDKFYFPDLGDTGTRFGDIAPQYKGKKVLYIGKPGDFPDNMPKLKRIYFLNGNEAFEIVETT